MIKTDRSKLVAETLVRILFPPRDKRFFPRDIIPDRESPNSSSPLLLDDSNTIEGVARVIEPHGVGRIIRSHTAALLRGLAAAIDRPEYYPPQTNTILNPLKTETEQLPYTSPKEDEQTPFMLPLGTQIHIKERLKPRTITFRQYPRPAIKYLGMNTKSLLTPVRAELPHLEAPISSKPKDYPAVVMPDVQPHENTAKIKPQKHETPTIIIRTVNKSDTFGLIDALSVDLNPITRQSAQPNLERQVTVTPQKTTKFQTKKNPNYLLRSASHTAKGENQPATYVEKPFPYHQELLAFTNGGNHVMSRNPQIAERAKPISTHLKPLTPTNIIEPVLKAFPQIHSLGIPVYGDALSQLRGPDDLMVNYALREADSFLGMIGNIFRGLRGERYSFQNDCIYYRHSCLHPTTLIMTRTTLLPISQLQKGMEVQSSDGNYYQIVTVTQSGKKTYTLITIETEGLGDTTLTLNHPVLTLNKDGEEIWELAGKLKKTTILLIPKTEKNAQLLKGYSTYKGKYYKLPITKIRKKKYFGSVYNLILKGTSSFVSPNTTLKSLVE